MIQRFILRTFAFSIMVMFMIGCGKDNGNPTIIFLSGDGYVTHDTMVQVNQKVVVSLEMNWNGADELEQLDAILNEGTPQSFPLTGEKSVYNLEIQKGTAESEKWTFRVLDRKGNQASVNLTLTKDPDSKYGDIIFYSPVLLGAQSNNNRGGFISFQTQPATTYSLEGAYSNQAKVDILYFSSPASNATLSSPGGEIPDNLYPGSRSINLWSVKNQARFLKSGMSAAEFVSISNDAAIVDGWSDASSVSKAADLKVDEIWLVKMQTGKLAAIRIKRIVAADDGEIELDIKVQQ